MKVSLNLVKDYLKLQIPESQLVDLIGRRLGEVDQTIDLKSRYQQVLVAKVVNCQPHPNADKLSVCSVDDGGLTKAPRDKHGHLSVVCGAANVASGQLIAYLPPGSVVPASHQSQQPVILEARQLRGVTSYGMIASAAELALGTEADGILVLDESVSGQWAVKPQVGQTLAEVYGLDDLIIDIENKMFTRRPDCFGLLGVAREIAGISHQPFKSPSWYQLKAYPVTEADDQLKLAVDPKSGVSRLTARVIDNLQVKPSPLKLQFKLATLGIKPVNNLVDITNYVMYLTGQPLHAFDYHKLAKISKAKVPTLSARVSNKSEQLSLLAGKKLKFDQPATVIAVDNQPVALGGIMGGSQTEIDNQTTKIVLEAATFDMYDIRRTTMHYGIFSEAATRFTKGPSAWQNLIAQDLAAEMMTQLAGAQASDNYHDLIVELPQPITIDLEPEFVNQRLGSNLSTKDMIKLLTNVEFEVKTSNNKLQVRPPFWRRDLAIAEDLVEEVGRLFGYQNLELELPKRSSSPPAPNQLLSLKQTIRQTLAQAGANEVLNYSFVSRQFLDRANQSAELAYRIGNALSPKLEYYRLSLTPSLLELVNPNIRQGYDNLAVFEIGVAHNQSLAPDEDGLPLERQLLSLVTASNDHQPTTAAFYLAKSYLNYLAKTLGIEFDYQPIDQAALKDKLASSPSLSCYQPDRSAWLIVNQQMVGIVGEFKPDIIKQFKLPALSSGFELDIELVLASPKSTGYRPILKYPACHRDLTFKVASSSHYSDLASCLRQLLTASGYWFELRPASIFSPKLESDTKNISFHLKLASVDQTLTAQQANSLVDDLVKQAARQLQAEVV